MIPMQAIDWRAAFATKVPEGFEKITWSFYDRQTYTSTSTTGLNYFQDVRADKLLGNIKANGAMTADESFAVMAIRFGLVADHHQIADEAADPTASGDPIEDIDRLINNGVLTLKIQNKDYGEWPLFMLPLGGGVWGSTSISGTTTAGSAFVASIGQNGVPDPRAVYTLSVPIVLPPLTNFLIRTEYPTAQTLLGGNQATIVILDGEIIRPQQ